MTKISEFSNQSDIFINLKKSLKIASHGRKHRRKVLCDVKNRNAIMYMREG